jgi:hypothetical protein
MFTSSEHDPGNICEVGSSLSKKVKLPFHENPLIAAIRGFFLKTQILNL